MTQDFAKKISCFPGMSGYRISLACSLFSEELHLRNEMRFHGVSKMSSRNFLSMKMLG